MKINCTPSTFSESELECLEGRESDSGRIVRPNDVSALKIELQIIILT